MAILCGHPAVLLLLLIAASMTSDLLSEVFWYVDDGYGGWREVAPAALQVQFEMAFQIWKGKGCPECHYFSYHWGCATYEISFDVKTSSPLVGKQVNTETNCERALRRHGPA